MKYFHFYNFDVSNCSYLHIYFEKADSKIHGSCLYVYICLFYIKNCLKVDLLNIIKNKEAFIKMLMEDIKISLKKRKTKNNNKIPRNIKISEKKKKAS